MARKQLDRPLTHIPPPPSAAKRNRDWERAQQGDGRVSVTFRRIPVCLRDRINAIAGELYVNRDEVARAILEAGMQAYEGGGLALEPKLIRGRFYLFGENAPDAD
jgi:hypothetical protein